MLNLRDRQIAAIGKMLTLSQGGAMAETSEDFADAWKVLIYDSDCRDIISPLMNIGALRQKGVTLHMLLHTDREAIQDAPAVYFVRPNEANIKRIVEDCTKQLYRSFYLHFVTRIDRPLMERLAQELVQAEATAAVSKVYDQHMDMIALEPSLFTLNIKDSFMAYNDPALGEQQIRAFMSRVCTGLLSLVRIMGTLPVIRAPTNGAAEMLAQELCNAIRDNLSSRGAAQALFAECLVSDRPRPLLLIVDRTSDMAPPLMHTSTYQALIDDLLDHRLNRVTVEQPAKDGTPSKKKTYDLNTQIDQFFGKYAGAPFPEAVEANEKELAEVSQREAEIRSKPASLAAALDSSASSGAGSGSVSTTPSGKDLHEAIESLPEILAKKANLEAHTNILQAVMKNIAGREVPTYFEIEQSMLTVGRVTDKAAVTGLLKDGSKGKLVDKARLLVLVSLLGETGASKTVTDEYDQAFAQGCAAAIQEPAAQADIDKVLAAASFVRRLQQLQGPMASSNFGIGKIGGAPGSAAAGFTSLLSSAQSRATTLMAKATSFFTKFSPLYVSRIADNLAEGRSCAEDDSFCLLDPRSRQGEAPVELKGQKYSDVIVFVVGGGCYSEFFNLQELLKQKAGSGSLRNITYGCSELLAGDTFFSQLERLAVPSSASSTASAAPANK